MPHWSVPFPVPEPLRVLVTRASPGELGSALAAGGCVVVHLPLNEQFSLYGGPPTPTPPPAGVLVTSAAVVRLAPHALGWMGSARVVAVGRATARALEAHGVAVDVVADGSGASALSYFKRDARPCFVGARRPAPALAEAVAAGRVQHWPVYGRRDLPVHQVPSADVVTLASPSAARRWAQVLQGGRPPCVVIGATTARAAVAAGLHVVATAAQPTMAGLAEAVVSGRWRG